ncbi:Fibronectin-binding protein A domain protein, partial [mine drainage metagenome]
RLNLGGEYSEEVAFRIGIEKEKPSPEYISRVDDIRSTIQEILQESLQNAGYYYSSQNLLSPIFLKSSSEEPEKITDFNEAIIKQMERIKEINPETSQIERRFINQKKTIDQYLELSVKLKNSGLHIITTLQEFDRILTIAKKSGKDLLTGQEIVPGTTISSIDLGKKTIIVNRAGEEIELSIGISAGENSNRYFTRSKEYVIKAEGAKRALEDTSKIELSSGKGNRKKERPKKWFESYHWFITSGGNLVVSGKDANGNEKVVKKHMGEKDIYIHADLYGAPSTILKIMDEESDVERDIHEAAQFAVSNSRAWANTLASGSAYWVTPLQVSKTPESGEYVRKGSWIVKGKRNYLFNLPLKLKISMITFENVQIPMICPDSTEIDAESDVIFISPGDIKREKNFKRDLRNA